MARTLPWLVAEDKKPTSKPTRELASKPRVRPRATSSSPPGTPPLQSRMQVGQDEAWIMVEDELLAAAQTFTRHLHVAEYKRLQNIVTRRNLTADSDTKKERPTDGKTKMSIEQLLKKEARDQLTKREKGIDELAERTTKRVKFASDVEESEEEPIIGDRNLAGLMQKGAGARNPERRLLTNIAGPLTSNSQARVTAKLASRPRARAPSSSDASTDDDDLDALPRVSRRQAVPAKPAKPKVERSRSPPRFVAPTSTRPAAPTFAPTALRDKTNSNQATPTFIKTEEEADKEMEEEIKPRFRSFGKPRTFGAVPAIKVEKPDRTSLKLEDIPLFDC